MQYSALRVSTFFSQVIYAIRTQIELHSMFDQITNPICGIVHNRTNNRLITQTSSGSQSVLNMSLQSRFIIDIKNSGNSSLSPVGRRCRETLLCDDCNRESSSKASQAKKQSSDARTDNRDVDWRQVAIGSIPCHVYSSY